MSKPINFLKIMTPIAFAIALTACGSGADFGDGDGGTTVTADGSTVTTVTNDDGTITTTTTNADGTTLIETRDADGNLIDSNVEDVVDSLSLTASSRVLLTNGNIPIQLEATAKDPNNNVLEGVDVEFSVNNDASIIDDQNSGAIKLASLFPDSKANRTVTVTATAGTITEEIDIQVTGTTLSVNGAENISINQPAEYTVLLRDSESDAIGFEEITISSAQNNTITTASDRTDGSGQLTFNYTADVGGDDTITVSALDGTASDEIDVQITGSDFTLTSTNDDATPINVPEIITVQWLDDGQPQVGEVIEIRTTRGSLNETQVITDADGQASFIITSTAPGAGTITAESDSGLLADFPVEFVATTPSLVTTQAESTTITILGETRVVTKVVDADNHPVKDIQVNYFLVEDDVNGLLSSTQAVTNELGNAEVIYEASDTISSFEGVTIGTSLPQFPDVMGDETSLTIVGQATSISLGTDETIDEDNDVFYVKRFGVKVVDNSGNVVADQEVDFTITPTNYFKGFMHFTGDVWERVGGLVIDDAGTPDDPTDDFVTSTIPATECDTEDLNRNGFLDPGENFNGGVAFTGTDIFDEELWPENDASVSTTEDSVTTTGVTDGNGELVIQVRYPQSRALWSTQRITATTRTEGTESVSSVDFFMSILNTDVNNEDVSPPNRVSPYGTAIECVDPN